MKKTIKTVAMLLTIGVALSSCYSRIGKMTVISTRNMDSKNDYVLLAKDVKGKAKTKKHEALEAAVDNAVKKFATGECMKNCIVEVSKSGNKIKVTGDVWGYEPKK